MNRFLSNGLMGGFATVLATSMATPAIASYFYDGGWANSVSLAQEQIDLLTEVEQSLYSTKYGFVQGSYRKLFFHIGELDRYLDRFGDPIATDCSAQSFDNPELSIYCSLLNSRPLLFQLLAATEQRQLRLSTAESSFLTPGSIALLSPELDPQESWQSEQDTFDVLVIGDAKPTQNQGDITRPAIAPLPETKKAIANQKSALLALNPSLPNGFLLEEDTTFTTTTTRYQYVPVAKEYEWHTDFLAQPNTGLTRLLPREAYEENYTASSLKPELVEKFPFPKLGETAPFPNLPLLVEDNVLKFVPESFNLGLITDLGETDFGNIQDLDTATPVTEYESPTTFAGLQQEQRRLLFQKDGRSPSTALLELDHLYLVRLVQYDFAEEILTGEPLPRYRFKELNLLADPDSYDVLIAIKPVKEWLDGGYTLLWQIIDQSEATALEDLADYIVVDSPIQP
ncbi:hypothetical protein Lepto7376_3291 [[Leptolyngbya] sp. PCC 7376]|uniref:hypothetical protein n=1 Tax=[Leptolyngbya] sp. PCC 7376 TaxID=111781 RepID=UPI00029EC867|nr:hypothetical protein [[Leptolyngbya] sp. PCC 7376]AFY39517.1 hypothetical protein Lepto7376_3291 [[Leptolyngbya] sp. PCC 7376]